MNLLKYTMILCFIVVFADISKAGPLLHWASNFIVTGVVPCPDDDEDGFFDAECGGFDCDDSDELVNPFAVEICNDIDDDCNGFVDEGFDLDSDGFTTCGGDCDDEVHAVNPGIEEWCFNGIDDDCDGMIDCDDEDDDDDLVDDIIEDGAPNDGDGNNDGTPDSWQKHVISIPNAVDGKYVTLETDPEHKLFAAMAVGNPSPFNDPPGVSFPLGFFEFEIELTKHGEESYIILYLPEGVVINTFYKFGPTPDNPHHHWYDFIFDGETGAQFLEDRVVLRFVDGKRGDDDITVNGLIFEPGGPGFEPIEIEDIDFSGCSLASSGSQASSNTILNLFLLFIPLVVIVFSVYRRKVRRRM